MKAITKFLFMLFVTFSLNVSALTLEGDLTQGSIVIGNVAPGSQVEYSGKKVRVSSGGQFVIGFSRDAELEQSISVIDTVGERNVHQIRLNKRDYNIQRINGISKKIMNPTKLDYDRIRREADLVRSARKSDNDYLDVFSSFEWPLDGPITGVYGSQRVYNGKPGRPHYGIDIAAKQGTPVKAPASGVVVLAHDDMFYSGGTLIVDHGHGVFSTFIHLHKMLVEVGQKVTKGDVIAQVGSTGRSTGPHLDWRMNWFDVRVDPRLLLPKHKRKE